jgi:gamma-glutamylcyclotransferase
MNVFCYGSNMSSARLHARAITPVVISIGYIANWQLCFNKRSYTNRVNGFANIEPSWESKVYGVIYDISEDDIIKLDKYEGYPRHYQKTTLSVYGTNQTYECITYIANRKWTTSDKLIVPMEYRNLITTGLEEHISKLPLMEAYINTVKTLML